jgi:hypothetical protein
MLPAAGGPDFEKGAPDLGFCAVLATGETEAAGDADTAAKGEASFQGPVAAAACCCADALVLACAAANGDMGAVLRLLELVLLLVVAA